MVEIRNIRVENDSIRPCIQWEIGDDRYHVWTHIDNQPEDTIYKNSIAAHNKMGYYHTRKLDRARSMAAATMFNKVWAVVERDALIVKAANAHAEHIKRVQRLSAAKNEVVAIEQTVLNLFRNGVVDRIASYRSRYVKLTNDILELEL